MFFRTFFGVLYSMNQLEESYYLAGLIENKINFEYSINKLRGQYYHKSFKIIYLIQNAFGGIGGASRRDIKFIKLNLFKKNILKMIEIFLKLDTPYKELYNLILEFEQYKEKNANGLNSDRLINKEKYFLTCSKFKENILDQQKNIKQNNILIKNKFYLNGVKDAVDYFNIQGHEEYKDKILWPTNIEKIKEINLKNKEEKDRNQLIDKQKKREQKILNNEVDRLLLEHQRKELTEEKILINKYNKEQINFFIKEYKKIKKLEKIQQAANLLKDGKKFCNLCKNVKLLIEFYSQISASNGVGRYCKKCIIDHHVIPNRKIINERVKRYQKNNPEKVRLQRKKDKQRPHNKIKNSIKNRIKEYLKSESIDYKSLIGCSPKELVAHIESQFVPDMSWGNYGEWEIDHIIPCAAFFYDKKGQLQWCWNKKNLRPLWKTENGNKSDIILGEPARRLKKSDPEKLKNIVSQELEKLNIATKQEYLESFKHDIIYNDI